MKERNTGGSSGGRGDGGGAARGSAGAAAAAAPPAPAPAPDRGSSGGGSGIGASLSWGMAGAKRALARALLGFALVPGPQRQASALRLGGDDADSARLFGEEDDGDDEDDEDGSSGGGGGSQDGLEDGSGSGGEGEGEGGGPPVARAPSAPLRRYGTLRLAEHDAEWAHVTDPRNGDALTAEELISESEAAAAASAEEARAAAAAAAAPGSSGGGGGGGSSRGATARLAGSGPGAAAALGSLAAAAAAQRFPAAAATAAPSATAAAPPRAPSPAARPAGLPRGALNLSNLRGGPAVGWEPPVFGARICKTEHRVVTSDGWTLHVVHTVDEGAPEGKRRRHPVLLCPGLASSGVGTFDLMPQVSIVDFLASEGWDVWCVCLRGNGASDKRSAIDLDSWTIDDHMFQDVPAVLAHILERTGGTQVHWIGHSMGGMLGCGLLSQGDSSRYSESLRSLVMYGSGCFGDGSWHSLLKRIVLPVTALGFPADLACQGLSLLTDKPAALSVFETLFYWFPNVDKPVRKRLLQSCFNYIPTTLTGQFLDSHDGPDGLTNVRHTFKYADPEVLADTAVPVLAINGDWDLFCPAPGGKKTADLFGGPKKALCIGTKHGHSSHYGHFDVVVGKRAREEVWPHVLAHLEEND
ncbi:hypothetical protein Rsub_04973 [Raphidocelis subcapitata]|uniref:AB hydrolase-1 domain-containing protein n=1 Tax=Raphidocelis subcapitata TaxID=307507 RepID=A0A2V0NW43_9CHLO|nr:hypothetical protein Rsub_04973 [Raphidocelis subcapitata]|eukprot:GBF91868.1 hypothetical protein Rsub_04973 [Raphidocelis subcapitata]